MCCTVQWLLISDFSTNVIALGTDPTSRDGSFILTNPPPPPCGPHSSIDADPPPPPCGPHSSIDADPPTHYGPYSSIYANQITRGLSAWQLRCLIVYATLMISNCLWYTAKLIPNDLDLTFQCHPKSNVMG